MSQKTLRNFQVVGALYSGVGAGAQPAQAGDEIRLFLNQVANPGFPEYIDGLIQLPVSEINMLDSGGHVVPGTSYTFSYESDDLEGAADALTACDIISASPVTCCVALREALDAEIAARAAGDTSNGEDIEALQTDLDTWDVIVLDAEPVQGVAGVPQVETQTVVGTIATAGTTSITVTGAGITGSPLALTIDSDAGDVPSVTSAKITAKLLATAAITALYDVDNIGADFALTEKVPNGNDGTLNIAITNGTATGLTPDATSTNTVAGVAAVTGTPAERIGRHARWGTRIWEAIATTPNLWVEMSQVLGVTNFSYPIAALSGGGYTELDSLVVDSGDLGRAQVVAATGNLSHYLHVLESGTDAEVYPYIIRPDNYDGVTNPVVWKWKPAMTNSESILDASSGGVGLDDVNKAVLFGTDGDITSTYRQSIVDASGFTFTIWSISSLTAPRIVNPPDAEGTLGLFQTVVPATPTDGFTITGTRYIDQTHYLTPAGTLATGTFTLPTAANSRVGQIIRLWSTQIVTALTVNVSGGGTILGTALTAAAANTPYAYQCVSTASTGTWIRLQ